MAWISVDAERVELALERDCAGRSRVHPVVAAINLVAEAALDIVEPVLWSVLVLLFGWAQLALH